MNNLTYRSSGSTFKLVLLVFLSGTGLLIGGYITGSEWTTGVVGLVIGYVVRDVGAKAAEAYRDKP